MSEPLSASRPTVERECLDPATLRELRQLDESGSSDVLSTVVDMYLAESSRLLPQLADAVRQRDDAAISRLAHALKSMSGNVGATTLVEHCGQLMRLGDARADSEVSDMLECLRREYQVVCHELARARDDANGSPRRRPRRE